MTLTWRTLRDYALRFVTFWAVVFTAFVSPAFTVYVAVVILRAYWLAFALSHVTALAWLLLALYGVLAATLLISGTEWRKNWLRRRFWIHVD
jgi:hypothetical protein